jgi:hypothetical protein
MTKEEVNNSFIDSMWYNQTDSDEYILSFEFKDMVRCGYATIFSVQPILPIQRLQFLYRENNETKMFYYSYASMDDLSVNSLIKLIEDLCNKYNLKFVGLLSDKYFQMLVSYI